MVKLITLFFIILLSQTSYAESGKGCEKVGKLAERLDLQEDQIEIVQQIMKEQQEKRRDLLQASRDSVIEMMAGLHNETKDKLSSILSPEQMAKFEEAHAKRIEKREQKYKKSKGHFKEASRDIDRTSIKINSI